MRCISEMPLSRASWHDKTTLLHPCFRSHKRNPPLKKYFNLILFKLDVISSRKVLWCNLWQFFICLTVILILLDKIFQLVNIFDFMHRLCVTRVSAPNCPRVSCKSETRLNCRSVLNNGYTVAIRICRCFGKPSLRSTAKLLFEDKTSIYNHAAHFR